jgi:hypothetical protein
MNEIWGEMRTDSHVAQMIIFTPPDSRNVSARKLDVSCTCARPFFILLYARSNNLASTSKPTNSPTIFFLAHTTDPHITICFTPFSEACSLFVWLVADDWC